LQIPGAGIAVLHNDTIIYEKGFGTTLPGASSCTEKLQAVCGAKRGSVFDCAQCAGQKQQQLLRAGCSNDKISAWCADVEPPGSAGGNVTSDTAFMFASLSKTHIAVAAMILVERGWLSVADDVNTYLNFSVRNPSFPSTPVTVHSLLTHSSSIHDRV